jgi:hypothetical protein
VTGRARGCCEYCLSQERFSPDPFSVEHVIPRSAGGGDDLDNLALSCQGCNNRKYTATTGIDPVSGQVVSLFHPRADRWGDYFAWAWDFTHVVALTPVGRATVEKLQLNRPGLVNLRRVLRTAESHPPEGGN